MALTKVQTNIIDGMSNIALQQLQIMEKYAAIVQMYAAENIASVTDLDMQTLPELAHVSASEVQAAKNAMDSLNTSLGNYAVGSNSAKLSKIIKNLP